MCDGVSEGLAAAALIGGAMKAAGSISQGNQQKAIAYGNAAIEDRAAGDARLRGATAAGQVAMRTSAQIGQEQAQVGSSGLESAGSPLDVISDKRWLSELDAQTVNASGEREADADATKAAYLRQGGDNAKAAGEIGAADDIIGAATQAAKFGADGWLRTHPTTSSLAGTASTATGTVITPEYAYASDWAPNRDDDLDAMGSH